MYVSLVSFLLENIIIVTPQVIMDGVFKDKETPVLHSLNLGSGRNEGRGEYV